MNSEQYNLNWVCAFKNIRRHSRSLEWQTMSDNRLSEALTFSDWQRLAPHRIASYFCLPDLLWFLFRCYPPCRNIHSTTTLVHTTTVHMWRWFHGLMSLGKRPPFSWHNSVICKDCTAQSRKVRPQNYENTPSPFKTRLPLTAGWVITRSMIIKHGRHVIGEIHEVRNGLWVFTFVIVPTFLEWALVEVGWETSFQQRRNLNQEVLSTDVLVTLKKQKWFYYLIALSVLFIYLFLLHPFT